jgi:hypothetical protein
VTKEQVTKANFISKATSLHLRVSLCLLESSSCVLESDACASTHHSLVPNRQQYCRDSMT